MKEHLAIASLPSKTNQGKSNEKKEWRQALKVMAKNPALLLEAVPSTWEQTHPYLRSHTDKHSELGDIPQ